MKGMVINMATAGMRRPDPEEPHGTESNKINHFEKNEVQPVPEIQGKAKHKKKKADIQYQGREVPPQL